MSEGQRIYQISSRLRVLTVAALLAFQLPLLAGCSDPEQKALAKGAEAQTLLDANRIAEARRAIGQAIAARDDIIALHLLRGRIETVAGVPGLAFSAYNNALLLDSSNSEALLGVAHFGMQSGNLRESEDAADRMLTLDPEQPDALLLKGIYNVMHFRGEAALANAEALLAKSPDNESGIILKVRALSILERYGDALTIAEAARKKAGPTPGITRTLLEFYRLNNDGPAMIRQLAVLRRADPKDRDFQFDEANTLYKLGQPDQARAILRAIILTPKIEEPLPHLVTNQWTEYDPAPLDPAGLAAVATKASAPAKKAVARFYLDRNDPVKAVQALGGALDADMQGLKAQAAIAQGQIQPGLQLAEQILLTDKTNCDALLARGQAMLKTRRYKEAITSSQLANANCPRLIDAYAVLAAANDGVKNVLAAEMAFQSGTTRNSQDSRLARLYANWLESKGKRARAIATARRVTNAAPALLSGWQLYVDLCTRNPDSACTEEAQTGLASAKIRYAVDRRPDDPEPAGLFSRLKFRNQDEARSSDGFDAAAAARRVRPITSAAPAEASPTAP